jgi:hypothetical protein
MLHLVTQDHENKNLSILSTATKYKIIGLYIH